MAADDLREMRVVGLSAHEEKQSPVLVLGTVDGKRALPIWVGQPEAASIIAKLKGVWPPRPLTHDLFKEALNRLGVRMARATMLERREDIIYAQVTLVRDGVEVDIDARPSDAVALALRMGAPIFARAPLLDRHGIDAPEGADSGFVTPETSPPTP